MNAVREMSIWLAALLVLLFQIQIPGTDTLSTVFHHSASGRKLFGGYRIVPKTCSATLNARAEGSMPKTGICMFNYECSQRGGQMIGSCVDGFLFGACCALPDNGQQSETNSQFLNHFELGSDQSTNPSANMQPYLSSTTQRQPSTLATNIQADFLNNIFTASEDPDELFGSFLSVENGQQDLKRPPQSKPILQQYLNNENQGGFIDNQGFLPVHKYPIADTVLLNPDGSFAVDEADPELLFTRPSNQKITISIQNDKQTTENYDFPSLKPGTFSYLTGSYGSPNKPGTFSSGSKIPASAGINGISIGYVTQRPPHTTTKTSAATEMRKTTKINAFPTEKYSVTPGYSSGDANLILLHTTSPLNKTVKPTPSASKTTTKFSYVTGKLPRPTTATVEMDDRYPGYNYESYTGISKPPIIITSPVGFDGSGQAISHILGILNGTHGKPVEQVTSSRPGENGAGLSTWVSITGGNNKISQIKTESTKLPATTTNYVHGPAFTVEENESKPVPTVIVISPPSTDASSGSFYSKPVTSSVSYVTKTPIRITNKPTTMSSKYPEVVIPAGEESLINFPPVRNPDLNVSGLNQMEKPTIVHSGGYPLPNGIINAIEILPDDVDLNTIDPDEDYSEFTTPAMTDESVNVKIHGFVEKIVNSLAGNFQDLEGVLFRNENKTKLTNQNGIELSNIHVGPVDTQTVTKKPTKPVRKPTVIPPQEDSVTEIVTKVSTKRPKPTTLSLTTPPAIITSKKPFIQIGSTKLTTTIKPVRRPTTPALTTKRPIQTSVTSATFTTRRPTTKKPKPSTTTKRTRPASTTTAEIPTEETDLPTTESSDSPEHSTVDFRKECGVRPMVKKGGRIVGGKGSQFGHYPWQVLVRESTWLGLFTKNKCGGVLITHRYVVTAAHCQPGFLASLVAVFGEYDISGELESRRSVTKNVRRVIVHRQYDPATFENDLALLELDSPISYDEHIVPICMPREGEDYTGRMAIVTGWGRLKYGGGVPSVLQEVRVPIIDNGVCQEMFQTAGHQKRIISSFLCAGYANGQKDSCEGDSGGPLMAQREDGHWILLGTVSHGIKCAAPYLPGVYMRTTYYKPWLKSITGVST